MVGLRRLWSIWCTGYIVLLCFHYRHFDMCCHNIFNVFTVCILFIVHNVITWLMLLALYACTNNYYKTTRYQGLINQKFEGEERANPRINTKSHISCREVHPEGSISGSRAWRLLRQSLCSTKGRILVWGVWWIDVCVAWPYQLRKYVDFRPLSDENCAPRKE